MLGYAYGTKRVVQDTDLKNPGWPGRTKDKPNKEQISRPKPKGKDQDQSQSKRPKQAHRPRTKAKD